MFGRANFLLPTILLLHTPLLLLLTPLPTQAVFDTMDEGPMLPHNTPLYMEIAVFVDSSLFTQFKETHLDTDDTAECRIRKILLISINAVESLFQEQSLGRHFSFVIKHLEIHRHEPPTLVRSHDIKQYFTSFCTWQSQLNRTKSQKWDHGLLLTGLGSNRRGTLSVAQLGGMCLGRRSCSLIDGLNDRSSYRIAFGIGTNFGIHPVHHDSDKPTYDSSHLMSPSLRNINWSAHSRNELERFLGTSQAECLFNQPEPSPPELDHNAEMISQSKIFDAYHPQYNGAVYVEIAVFVDSFLFTHMKENHFSMDSDDTARRKVRRVVLAMIKAVELLYQDPSLGRQISFVVKRLEILDNLSTLNISNNINQYLANFCKWQSELNPTGSQKWDVAVLLTGINLEATSEHQGKGRLEGMCTGKQSCLISNGRHFGSVYIMAHEIGHTLGMYHDDPFTEPSIMHDDLISLTTRSGNINWSTRSRNELRVFLRSSQAECLFNIPEPSPPYLDHNAENFLPGEIFNAQQQCIFMFGPMVNRGNYNRKNCKHLHCLRNGHSEPSGYPALEGTRCGQSKWCRMGECIDKQRFKREVNDISVEDSWSSWTECASACLWPSPGHPHSGSVGISYSTQKCNGQRRKSGPQHCLESRRSYQVCNTNKCANVPPKSVQNYANDVCSCASGMDDTLTGGGSQRISSDPIEACTIWCSQKSGGSKSHGWRYPDGTACLTKDYNWKRPSYCIDGACRDFGEDGLLLEPYEWLQHSELLQYAEWLQHPEWQINLCGLLHRGVERSLLLSPVQVNASIDINSHSAPIKHLDFNDESQIKQP